MEDIPESPQAWAEAKHVRLDRTNSAFPVSGTMLRRDLALHWKMLAPPAKAHLARRVCILGTESSGKTTLACQLAKRNCTAWVPEYGRYYWEGRRRTPDQASWQGYEFLHIAQGQTQWESHLAARANKILICDTAPLSTLVWSRRYLGSYQPSVAELAKRSNYSLTLLTEPDFEFVQDGTRESRSMRRSMHQWFIELLEEKELDYVLLKGSPESRLEEAQQLIAPLMIFPPLKEP